jgi:DNA-directed RNA polymerase subunit RPC12/RpoP
MPIRICSRCKKKFDRKSSYDYHVKRINKCDIKKSVKRNNVKPNVEEKEETDKPYHCSNCKKGFTRKGNRDRHLANKICFNEEDMTMIESIKEEFEEFKQSNQRLEKENDNLKAELEKLRHQVEANDGNNTMIYMDNRGSTVNNNYILVAYGKEDIDSIDQSKLLECMKSGFDSTYKLTEVVHFDPKRPAYHNIFISNLKNKYAMVYEDDRWQTVMKEDVIDRLYNNKRDYIEDNMELFFDRLKPSQQRALHRYLNISDDDKKIKEIKEDIKLLLHNKRDLPQKHMRCIKEPKL